MTDVVQRFEDCFIQSLPCDGERFRDVIGCPRFHTFQTNIGTVESMPSRNNGSTTNLVRRHKHARTYKLLSGYPNSVR